MGVPLLHEPQLIPSVILVTLNLGIDERLRFVHAPERQLVKQLFSFCLERKKLILYNYFANNLKCTDEMINLMIQKNSAIHKNS